MSKNTYVEEGKSGSNYNVNPFLVDPEIGYNQFDNLYSRHLLERLQSTDTGEQNITPGNIINELDYSFSGKDNMYDSLYHANNLRRFRNEIYGTDTSGGRLFTDTFRFGVQNPYGHVGNAKEFVFFTKPDLHIFKVDDNTFECSKTELNKGINTYFWQDLAYSKKRIIALLQYGYLKGDPFNHLLQNTLINTLEVPSLNAPSVETSTNTYGVNLTYRGSSEESDDGPEFSLEFKDDRYLNVYTFFRAYEEYETMKKHGIIAPQKKYIMNKILHDQFSIYKFIVDEDMETIIYWGKYYGVYPTSLPRNAFSDGNFQDGITFNINFKAAFYEDMRPEILQDFNYISETTFKDECRYYVDIYNSATRRNDGRCARSALVQRVSGDARAQQNPNG